MTATNSGLRIDLAVRQFIEATFPNREPNTFPDLVIQALDAQDARIKALDKANVDLLAKCRTVLDNLSNDLHYAQLDLYPDKDSE